MSDEIVTLPLSHTPRLDDWRLRLHRRFGSRLKVVLTRNRRSMISILRPPGGPIHLRLQIGFEEAPEEILADIEEVIAHNNPSAWKRVCLHARSMSVDSYTPSSRGPPLRTLGKHFDLQRILDDVNARFFQGAIEARITWGSPKHASPPRRPRRSRTLQFGVWDESRRIIRIHAGLDRPGVPLEFMRYLVHHELCHAASPPRRGPNGQRLIHHEDFRTLERRFPGLRRMKQLGTELFEQITRERERPAHK